MPFTRGEPSTDKNTWYLEKITALISCPLFLVRGIDIVASLPLCVCVCVSETVSQFVPIFAAIS